jgi:hypothetical protein
MSVLIQFRIRRDTAANWTTQNPILASGEVGLDTTNNYIKVGDGVNTWSNLSPVNLFIPNDTVTFAQLQNFSTHSRLLGSPSNSTEPSEIIIGDGLQLVGNTLSTTEYTVGALVSNRSGATIPKGSVVYINGSHNQVATIALARADAYSTADVVGVLPNAIPNNSTGLVITQGVVSGLNTSSLIEGQSIYLSPIVYGGLTSTEPSPPNLQIQIGWCEYSQNNNGKILVRVNPEFTKSEYIADSTAIGRGVLTAATTEAARTSLGFGTVVTKDVPVTGNASTTQVVMGNDTRLTDSRTPVYHTHVSNDVTNFNSTVDTIVSGSPLDGGSF